MGRIIRATAGVLLALSIGTGLTMPTAFPATATASTGLHLGGGAQAGSLVNQTGCDDDGGPDTERELPEGGQDSHSSGS